MTMDIPRAAVGGRRKKKRIAIGGGVLILVALVTVGLAHLKPAAPLVDRSNLWIDTVKRGEMVRQVRGSGSLVPEEFYWIPAVSDSRVVRLRLHPGAPVTPDTVILELSNPQLELEAHDAESELRVAEADLTSLQAQLDTQRLNVRSEVAQVETDYSQARLQAEVDQQLAKEGLLAEISRKLSTAKADGLKSRLDLSQQQLELLSKSTISQIAAQNAKVEKLRAAYELKAKQVESLKVRSPAAGVLQQVLVEVGQHVAPGANLARVANSDHLKAVIRVSETQAKDIQIGQLAVVDTHNGTIPGRIQQIDPSVLEGTVGVTIGLEGQLPPGSRPDLSVEAMIELEKLENVLFVGRPTFAREHSTVGIFKVVDKGRTAVRASVKLGRSSVNTIEVLGGLADGDQVILSDIAGVETIERIRLD